MSTGVLCHCDQTDGPPEDGHPLGTPGCSSVVKTGNWRPSALCGQDHWMRVCSCHGPARGTCPECGKRVKVVRIETRGPAPERKRGPLLGVALGMAPHKVGGRDCPGAGQVPKETTYRPVGAT